MSDDYHVAEPVGAQPVQVDKASGMAIAALVLGILGFCCCGFITGVPALIIGWIENSKINRGESSQRGKGFAIVGIVLGVVSLVFACLGLLWTFFFGGLGVLQQIAHTHP
jgi:hypothetical protein